MLEVSVDEGKSFRCRAATSAIAHDRRWLDRNDDDDEDDEDQPDEPAVVREPDEERPTNVTEPCTEIVELRICLNRGAGHQSSL